MPFIKRNTIWRIECSGSK